MTTAAAVVKEAPLVHLVQLGKIKPSPSNPRKNFADVDELADDIKLHGLLSPVLLRPRGDGYELVFGERRWRAAKKAGLDQVPAFVRELGDQEALELQIVENAKRTDIHPVEEAEAYRELHEKHKLSVDEIAAKVGKSKAHVYGRIKLCELAEPVKKAALAGELPATHALLIARIPAALQEEALKAIGGNASHEPLSYRDAAEHVHRNFMLQLKDAPFELTDAKLLPKAGACSTCPKRTGNQPELFADVKAKDTCTDPKCYHAKEEALWQLKVKDAEKNGQRVIEGKAAEKLFYYGGSELSGGSGFRKLDSEEWVGEKTRTVKSLLGKDAPPPTLIRSPNGTVVEAVPAEIVQKKIREIEPDHGKRPSSSGDSYAKQQRDAARKQKVRAAVVATAMPLLVDKAEQDAKGAFLRFVADAMRHHSFSDGVRRAVARRGLKADHPDDALRKELRRGLTPKGLRGWIAEVVAGDNATGGSWDSRYGVRFEEACKLFGINLKKLEETEKTKAKKPAVGAVICAIPGCCEKGKRVKGSPGLWCDSHGKKLSAAERKSITDRNKRLAAEKKK